MPYQFVLASPFISSGRTSVEYYSDQGDRGDVPNIVSDERKAKRFATQAEAAQHVGNFMHAKDHMRDVIRASLGRIASEFMKPQDYSPIHIVPVE